MSLNYSIRGTICQRLASWLMIMVVILGIFLKVPPLSAAQAETDLDALTDEQAALAQEMLNFMEETEKNFFTTVAGFNGDVDMETRDFDSDKASYKVKVTRGSVIEKGAFMTNISKKANPPWVPEPVWHRYMEIDVHPKTPLVGQLHATVHFAYYADGTSAIAGYMDYTPAAWIDEDVALLKDTVDGLFQRYGRDITRFRAMLEKPYHKDKLKAAAVGAGLYGRPLMEINQANLDFVKDLYGVFVGTYMEILDQRKDQDFTEEDLKAQDGMRKRWLVDHLFSDPFTMNVVPFEVWSFADQAPTIKF